MTRTYRIRRGLTSGPTGNWIAAALAKQDEPHQCRTSERTGNCRDCGLPPAAPVHTDPIGLDR